MLLERLALPPAPPPFHVPDPVWLAIPDPAEVPPPILLVAITRLERRLPVQHLLAPFLFVREMWGQLCETGLHIAWHVLDETYYYPARHPRLSGMPIPVRLLPAHIFHPIVLRILLFLDGVCPRDLLVLLTAMSIRLSVARRVAPGL